MIHRLFVLCPSSIGQYGASSAQSACTKCATGYYSAVTGSSSACTACSEGSFAQRTGMIACNDCAAGDIYIYYI